MNQMTQKGQEEYRGKKKNKSERRITWLKQDSSYRKLSCSKKQQHASTEEKTVAQK